MSGAPPRGIAYTQHMMSDKFLQQIIAESSDIFQDPRGESSAATPFVNRSTATMQAVRAYILSHDLQPGSPLPTEAVLCAELGVSRSSVREALRKLEALDIVRVHQGRGAFVADMSLRPLVDTLILRSSLTSDSGADSLADVVALRKYLDLGISADVVAALKGTENPVLHAAVAAMDAKAAAGERYLEEDATFHSGILDAIGNSVAKQMVSALWLVHMAVIPDLVEHIEAGLEDTARAHRAILDAAEAGDLKGYRKAVRAHYRPLEQILARRRTAEPQPE